MRFFRRRTSDSSKRSKRVQPPGAEPIEVQIMSPDSLDILRAHDISESGVAVVVPHRFEGCDMDASVQLVLTLPGRRPFLARGKIRHITEEGGPSERFGVEFTEIRARHRAWIASFIAGQRR